MNKYLYGASVQGIQGFIFQTNKLAEIIGASELVEQICTTKFKELATIPIGDKNLILAAAGNIKYVFEDEHRCRAFVRLFPKEVMQMAPGISVSQAVVAFKNDIDLPDAIQELEKKLKTQRNLVATPSEIGFMGLERSRRTGGVAFSRKGLSDVICESTSRKRLAVNSQKEKKEVQSKESLFYKISGLAVKNSQIAFDIKDITASGKNSWIAVIHADGNGLGTILQNKGAELIQKGKFTDFSNAIETANIKAVQKAFNTVVLANYNGKDCYPIRPVVLGGDDLTIIIRADLALNFTEKFLKEFETSSREEFEAIGLTGYELGITACAGIAFVKESYPLHYALHLAEQLCNDAKKKVKADDCKNKYGQVPQSSLSFYKVQDSFVADLKELKERTLKTRTGVDFYGGPYLLNDVDQLKKKLEIIEKEAEKSDKSKAVGKLRQLVSEYYKDESTASFMLKRMKEINKDYYNKLEMEEITNSKKSQLLDLITLQSFNYGNREN